MVLGHSESGRVAKFGQHLGLKAAAITLVLGLISLAAADQTAGNSTPAPTTKDDASSAGSSNLQLQVEPAPATDQSAATPPEGSANSAGSSLNTSVSSSSSGDTNSSVQVSVNGQPVSVPRNGTKQEIITTPTGNTSVTVSNNQSGNANNTDSSFTTSSNYSSDINSVMEVHSQ